MKLILTSLLRTHEYASNGARVPNPLGDGNGVLSAIRDGLGGTRRLVVVANDPNDHVDNDEKLATVGESFERAGLRFSEKLALDARNADAAADIVAGADIVILSGGKCVCQNKFFVDIGLKEIFDRFDGVVVGISAGTMNMCKTVANYPEEPADLNDPLWFDGLGFVDETIVPHFDGSACRYQFPCDGLDPVRDYILPMSFERELTGLSNDAYIIIDRDGRKLYRGDVYSIRNGKTKKL